MKLRGACVRRSLRPARKGVGPIFESQPSRERQGMEMYEKVEKNREQKGGGRPR